MGDVEMVIYGYACRWTAPSLQAMEPDEVLALVQRLANELSGKIEIDLGGDRSRIVTPAPR